MVPIDLILDAFDHLEGQVGSATTPAAHVIATK
jgi:hypothetical protein